MNLRDKKEIRPDLVWFESAQRPLEVRQIDRFLEKVIRTLLEEFPCERSRSISWNDNNANVIIYFPDQAQGFRTVHMRHWNIEKNGLGLVIFRFLTGTLGHCWMYGRYSRGYQRILYIVARNSSSSSTKSRLSGFMRSILSFAVGSKSIGQAKMGKNTASMSAPADKMGAVAEKVAFEQAVQC